MELRPRHCVCALIALPRAGRCCHHRATLRAEGQHGRGGQGGCPEVLVTLSMLLRVVVVTQHLPSRPREPGTSHMADVKNRLGFKPQSWHVNVLKRMGARRELPGAIQTGRNRGASPHGPRALGLSGRFWMGSVFLCVLLFQ